MQFLAKRDVGLGMSLYHTLWQEVVRVELHWIWKILSKAMCIYTTGMCTFTPAGIVYPPETQDNYKVKGSALSAVAFSKT